MRCVRKNGEQACDAGATGTTLEVPTPWPIACLLHTVVTTPSVLRRTVFASINMPLWVHFRLIHARVGFDEAVQVNDWQVMQILQIVHVALCDDICMLRYAVTSARCGMRRRLHIVIRDCVCAFSM